MLAVALVIPLAPSASTAATEPNCAERSADRVPATFEGCASLQRRVENTASFMGPEGFKLAEYEALLSRFFDRYCHRNGSAGWVRDKRLRDVGPFVAILEGGRWVGPKDYGTHQPVVIWYNRSMVRWLERNRPAEGEEADRIEPIPDGAFMVKEMYPAPAARCAGVPPEHLVLPASTGLAFMIRDRQNAVDGWFWGAWWDGFEPDWPASSGNGLTAMGFGLYCLNCHASAESDQTFADLKNVRGYPGTPNVYLSQTFLVDSALADRAEVGRHRAAIDTSDDPPRQQPALETYDPAFAAAFPRRDPPTAETVDSMPSQTYDHVWVPGDGPTVASEFVTSDQCLGCHDAGSTGLQFDMTVASPRVGKLLNYSPYGTWRTSPMGLAGRDPVFFAQLASETETFHPTRSPLIQDVCLGCHGIQGQRQSGIDRVEAGDDCGRFLRGQLEAIPYPSDPTENPDLADAAYGALGRDGIACTACHRMALTAAEIAEVEGQPQNRCVEERQALLNPESRGFARTFTGSFYVGPPDELLGPFGAPKTKPMEHALGIRPVEAEAVRSSDLCGTCHTVHLPVYGPEGRPLGFTYEQTTYPEWAFSAYRTGATADREALPLGAGARAESCQGCHMRSSDREQGLFRSKIASIQERSNFPATDNTLPADEIDLEVREGFARHTLVGLNVFLVEMAQQFPEVLGIPTQDPMTGSLGLDPVLLTEQAMLDQASHDTASLELRGVARRGDHLRATVTVGSQVGHKLPSGVGFRRAFLELAVLDGAGDVLWASGRTDGAGIIVDEGGSPVAGELWWRRDCSERLPGTPHQPHYQTITRQDQVQIYQELVTSPAPVPEPRCGPDTTPGGQLTTSFLSICGHVKDNRILPHGFLGLADRVRIAEALGAGRDLAEDSGPSHVGDDPDYTHGGADSLEYQIDLGELTGEPIYVQATLYYQATPPFFLQDRFCTSQSTDTDRLYYLAGHLDLANSRADDWKLEVVSTGRVPVPR